MEKERVMPYPLRLKPGIKERLEDEAIATDRSLNFIINQHVINSLAMGDDSQEVTIQKIKHLVRQLEQSL